MVYSVQRTRRQPKHAEQQQQQSTFKSHDLYSDWVTRKWELGGANPSDNCKAELKKKHVVLPPGRSLRNPNI